MLAYGTSVPEQYRQAAGLLDKMPKGARPAELPVERPTKFELVIDRKAASALGPPDIQKPCRSVTPKAFFMGVGFHRASLLIERTSALRPSIMPPFE